MGATRNTQTRLIVFDVEGVLIPKNRFIYEVIKSLGFLKLLKALILGFLYLIGVLPLGSALKQIFRMMRGMPQEKLARIAEKIPLMLNVKETINALERQGNKIALISSGLPNFVVKKLSDDVRADYAVGFEVGLDGDTVNGEIQGDVIEHSGKHVVLSRILNDEGMNANDCVVVADDRNNVPMFRSSKLKIGYNPDFVTRLKADCVVTGNLEKILPLIEGKQRERYFPSANDFLRETIHFSAISVPILVMTLGLAPVVLTICIIVALYAVSELARMEGRQLPIISQITNLAASQHERYEFAAAPIYFALGILLSLLLFPAQSSSGAIAIFAAGDSSASLFGGFSKTMLPFNKGKSYVGSVAGFVFAFIAGSVFVAPWKALVGALVAMTVEAIPLPVNDNILMPLSAGLALTCLP